MHLCPSTMAHVSLWLLCLEPLDSVAMAPDLRTMSQDFNLTLSILPIQDTGYIRYPIVTLKEVGDVGLSCHWLVASALKKAADFQSLPTIQTQRLISQPLADISCRRHWTRSLLYLSAFKASVVFIIHNLPVSQR